MYLAFFGLAEKPFSITPDPRYLYLSARHADALAHLVYGINEAGGFVQLTGEVGTGKTTIIRSLLARTPQNAEIALILNPRLSPTEFLLSLCEELGHQLAAMVTLQIQVIHVHSEAGRTHHDVRKRVPLKRVNKRVITTILRDDNDAVEGLISDDSFEIISQSRVFVGLDFEPQTIMGSVDHL